MFRVRLTTRGRSTTTPFGSVIVGCAKSSGFDSVTSALLMAAIVTGASRRGVGAGCAVSGSSSSSPTCQFTGTLAKVMRVAPARRLSVASRNAVLRHPTRV